MSKNQSARYVYTVKEGEGTFWLGLEPYNGEPRRLKAWSVNLGLPEVTSVDRAQQIANFMNENLGEFFLTPPWVDWDRRLKRHISVWWSRSRPTWALRR